MDIGQVNDPVHHSLRTLACLEDGSCNSVFSYWKQDLNLFNVEEEEENALLNFCFNLLVGSFNVDFWDLHGL